MKNFTLSLLVSAAVLCSLGATDVSAQATRCRSSNCFDEHDVRDFEVLTEDTMVVYVGRKRCPFLIRVDSLYCDLTFVPDVGFMKTRGRTDGFRSTRVCTHDVGIGLDTFGFGARDVTTDQGANAATSQQMACRIREFRPLSDDEIIELYVDQGIIAPPPPVGTGQISRVGDDDEAETESSEDAEESEAEQG